MIMISIIIPCYNEEKYLPQLFESLKNLNIGDFEFEVILVDNGSTDNSVKIAKKNTAKVISSPHGSIAYLRNLGTKHASGVLFAFLDADCCPSKDWLIHAYNYWDHSNVGLFGSIPLCPDNGTWVEKTWVSTNPQGPKKVNFICTANMFIKKEVFEAVNGFNENLTTGEDYDICQRILNTGYTIIHDDSISSTHMRYPKTMTQRFKKEIWYGEQMFKILRVNLFYRPFWASLIYGISLFSLFIAFFGNSNLASIYFLIFMLLPLASAYVKVKQGGRGKYLFKTYILFHVYLLGRFLSIIQYLWGVIRKFLIATRLKVLGSKP